MKLDEIKRLLSECIKSYGTLKEYEDLIVDKKLSEKEKIDIEIAEKELREKIERNRSKLLKEGNFTPFSFAILCRLQSEIEILIKNDQALINKPIFVPESLFLYGVLGPEKADKVAPKDKIRCTTPVALAIAGRDFELARYLLEQGADPDAKNIAPIIAREETKYLPLELVILLSHELLKQCKTYKKASGDIAREFKKLEDLAHLLLQKNANPKQILRGLPAVLFAVFSGNPKIVSHLIHSGANINEISAGKLVFFHALDCLCVDIKEVYDGIWSKKLAELIKKGVSEKEIKSLQKQIYEEQVNQEVFAEVVGSINIATQDYKDPSNKTYGPLGYTIAAYDAKSNEYLVPLILGIWKYQIENYQILFLDKKINDGNIQEKEFSNPTLDVVKLKMCRDLSHAIFIAKLQEQSHLIAELLSGMDFLISAESNLSENQEILELPANQLYEKILQHVQFAINNISSSDNNKDSKTDFLQKVMLAVKVYKRFTEKKLEHQEEESKSKPKPEPKPKLNEAERKNKDELAGKILDILKNINLACVNCEKVLNKNNSENYDYVINNFDLSQLKIKDSKGNIRELEITNDQFYDELKKYLTQVLPKDAVVTYVRQEESQKVTGIKIENLTQKNYAVIKKNKNMSPLLVRTLVDRYKKKEVKKIIPEEKVQQQIEDDKTDKNADKNAKIERHNENVRKKEEAEKQRQQEIKEEALRQGINSTLDPNFNINDFYATTTHPTYSAAFFGSTSNNSSSSNNNSYSSKEDTRGKDQQAETLHAERPMQPAPVNFEHSRLQSIFASIDSQVPLQLNTEQANFIKRFFQTAFLIKKALETITKAHSIEKLIAANCIAKYLQQLGEEVKDTEVPREIDNFNLFIRLRNNFRHLLPLYYEDLASDDLITIGYLFTDLFKLPTVGAQGSSVLLCKISEIIEAIDKTKLSANLHGHYYNLRDQYDRKPESEKNGRPFLLQNLKIEDLEKMNFSDFCLKFKNILAETSDILISMNVQEGDKLDKPKIKELKTNYPQHVVALLMIIQRFAKLLKMSRSHRKDTLALWPQDKKIQTQAQNFISNCLSDWGTLGHDPHSTSEHEVISETLAGRILKLALEASSLEKSISELDNNNSNTTSPSLGIH